MGDKIKVTDDDLKKCIIVDSKNCSLPANQSVSPTPSPTKPPQRTLSPRMRRLVNDADLIQRRLVNFKLIKVKDLRGNPPDVYIIEYLVRGIETVVDGNITYRDSHQVEFKLTSDYPRMSPKCRMLTPGIPSEHRTSGDLYR
jgi:hypothetical protein